MRGSLVLCIADENDKVLLHSNTFVNNVRAPIAIHFLCDIFNFFSGNISHQNWLSETR